MEPMRLAYRRRDLAVCVCLAGFAGGCGRTLHRPEPPLSAAEVVRWTPAALIPTRVEVAPRENGFPPAAQAAEECATAMRDLPPSPTKEDAATLAQARKALRTAKPAMDKLRRALRFPVWQAPLKNIGGMEFLRFDAALRGFIAEARVRLHDGDAEGAADDLSAGREIARRLREADVDQGDWMVAHGAEGLMDRAIQVLAWDPRTSRPAVARLLRAVPEPPDRDLTYPEAIRLDFAYDSSPTFAKDVPGPDGGRFLGSDDDPGYDDALKEVLQDHPRPFDRTATFALAARTAFEDVEQASLSWPDWLRLPPRPGPYSTWPVAPGEIEHLAKLSPAQRADLGKRLRYVPNPYGVIVVTSLRLDPHPELAFAGIADDRATRLILEARLYALGHGGELPDRLPPERDPFGTGSFRYDRARRRIWSVGTNGTDDGGHSALASLTAADLVWPVDGKFPQKASTAYSP